MKSQAADKRGALEYSSTELVGIHTQRHPTSGPSIGTCRLKQIKICKVKIAVQRLITGQVRQET